MPQPPLSSAALDTYYDVLARYGALNVTHESAVRKAFADLLDTACKSVGWTLVLEQSLANRKRPDATLFDRDRLPRGYWEAKDTADDLETEIRAKTNRGYPLINTIFEDSRRGILFQNGQRAFDADLSKKHELVGLIERFVSHTSEQIEEFHQAVREFQNRIPDLARELMDRIAEERAANRRFVEAFAAFHELCRGALNPAISAETIDEMLVQHLLTERLFRTVFDNPDFTARNVIAREIESVIQALTSRAFSRHDFLRKLDYFYVAIENTARTIDDWSEKQQFLNTVYERFFQSFSRKQADTHGIVYTPQPIVDFMCASVEEVLQREFGKSLSDPGVNILDPCVGTGNFIVNILRRIRGADLKRKYSQELFCNEIMLLPYYIATLNIEHAYYERTGEYEPFEGICFADTLDMAEEKQLAMFAEENTGRVQRQKDAEITVVIGNPPYNVGQQSENDQNKNRKYLVVDQRIRSTYARDSRATLNTKLYDPYTRFFRWAADRLQGRDGIVCFVSNNSFVDQVAFDGMRKHLVADFDQIYHLDLHGNVRQNPKLSGTTHNVFGIQVGVGITIAIRSSRSADRFIRYYRAPETWRATEKLAYLSGLKDLADVEWQTLRPDAQQTWITEGLKEDFRTLMPIGTKQTKSAAPGAETSLFRAYSLGVSTNRDAIAYGFRRDALGRRVEQFIETFNGEVSRYMRAGRPKDVDGFVRYEGLKWSRNLKRDLRLGRLISYDPQNIRLSMYRPFTPKYVYLADTVVDEGGTSYRFFHEADPEALTICVSTIGHRAPFGCLAAQHVPNLNLSSVDAFQCFPFYTYDKDGSNRRENITDWALQQFQAQYGPEVTKRDIFHYVYAILHHPAYRERFAENLKRELPRIPFIADEPTGTSPPLPPFRERGPGGEGFRACVDIGAKLMELHLNYESAPEYPLTWRENREVPFSWRVEKMRLSPEKDSLAVNPSLTLDGIPPDCLDYRLGNRSALEWVVDQYQVKTDKRSGIVSNPNRPDDPEYIVRLVGRVITVSLETLKLIRSLPPLNVIVPNNKVD